MGFAPIILAEIASRPPGIEFFLLLVIIYSSYFFVKGILAYLRRMSIQNLPTAKARSAAVGMVELHGKAKSLGEPLVSPFYGFKCLYYAVVVEDERKGKSGSNHYTELKNARLESTAPFLLEDETGTITVDPKDASIYILKRDMYCIGPLSKFPKDMRDFLDKKSRGEPIPDRIANFLSGMITQRYRVREFTISEGDEIYVFGNAKIPKSQPTYDVSNALVVSKGEPWQDFILADHPEEKLKGGFVYPMLIAGMAFLNILLCALSFGFYSPCIATQIGIFTIILWVIHSTMEPSLGKA